MKQTHTLLTIAVAAALTGCADDSPVSEELNDTPPPSAAILSNDAPPANEIGNEATNVTQAAGPIPPALHGRWGLTPAACESSTASEGLLVVTAEELNFYESRAEPVANIEDGGDSISGEFAFTGEGQTERRFMSLQIQEDKLLRSGNGPAASFTYVRCDPQAG